MTVEPASLPAHRRARLGLWLGGMYLLPATAVFVLTVLTTTPDKVGLDWIPFMIIAMPWSGLNQTFAIPGVLLNAVILWALGTSLQVLVRYFRGD